ncbi:MAG TPA: RluA family pseudouridine synthase [Holophagaceae bacterium]|nr:RluA family pseudouridine synthase [Holophagaceae bacterium]
MAKLDQTWTVEAHHAGSALAAELHRHLGVSHRQAKGLIDARCVKVNGETALKHGQRVEPGDRIAALYDPELKYEPIAAPKGASDNAFQTLYEDTHLLFVDKPAGLLTVPAEQGGDASLADMVADHYRRRGQKHAQLFIVHRLDRFTSGVLVFARTPEALHHLKKLFNLHKLQRTYRAILVGELPENQGTLKGHLIEQAKTLKMRVVDPKRRDAEGAQAAVTHYRVVERLPGHTVVEVELETGRRNQIRVQFADRGFPLLGDQVYGEESPLIDRQALHAEVLGVKHPVKDETVTVKAPLPADFEAALKALRARTRLQRAAAGETGAPEPLKRPRAASERRAPAGDRRPAAGGRRPASGDRRPGSGARPDRPSRPRPEGSEDRPRKRFDRPQGAGPARPRREEGPGRLRREEGSDRPRPKRFEDREERPRAPRAGGKPAGKPTGRPARSFEDRPPREGAARPRRFEDRPERTPGAKPARPSQDRPRQEGRPREDRPRRTDRPHEDRPREAREDRPRASRPASGRPRTEGRPADSAGERPRRPFDRKAAPASGPRGGKPSGPRREGAAPRPGGFKPKPGGAKPKTGGARKPFGKGPGKKRG